MYIEEDLFLVVTGRKTWSCFEHGEIIKGEVIRERVVLFVI